VADLLFPPDVLENALVQLEQERVERQPVDRGTLQHLGVRQELDERETPTQRGIEQPDAPVRGVHRCDDEDVRRDEERLAAVGQEDTDPALVELEEGDELAENLRDITPVDFVDED
jgi:hypothetical protein